MKQAGASLPSKPRADFLKFTGTTFSAEQPGEEEKLSGQEGELARWLANVCRKAPGIQDCRPRHEWETQ